MKITDVQAIPLRIPQKMKFAKPKTGFDTESDGHASIHCSHNTIDADELPCEMLEHNNVYKKTGALPESSNLSDYLSFREEEFLRHMIGKNKGNITSTAKALGVSRMTLYSKLKKYSIV